MYNVLFHFQTRYAKSFFPTNKVTHTLIYANVKSKAEETFYAFFARISFNDQTNINEYIFSPICMKLKKITSKFYRVVLLRIHFEYLVRKTSKALRS